MHKVSEFSVNVQGAQNGFRAPEVIEQIVRSAWEDEAHSRGINFLAYKPVSGEYEGKRILAWLVDEEEDMYYVLFDLDTMTVSAGFRTKAKRVES